MYLLYIIANSGNKLKSIKILSKSNLTINLDRILTLKMHPTNNDPLQ